MKSECVSAIGVIGVIMINAKTQHKISFYSNKSRRNGLSYSRIERK